MIESVVHDSRLATPGSLYACLRGDHFDGHDFAVDAVRAGATAVLADHHLDGLDVDGAGPVAQIVVDDTRLRLGPIAAEVAGHPSRALATVGITGTNGKTTTAALLAAIFEAAGRPCGVVGTLSGPRTTPEAPELQSVLAGFVADAKTAAVLEVSSHALAMHRVDGTEFDAVVFTNLGHDHLDLHGTHEAYFRAKAKLFDPSFAGLGVVNLDDAYGRLIADASASEQPGREFRVVGLQHLGALGGRGERCRSSLRLARQTRSCADGGRLQRVELAGCADDRRRTRDRSRRRRLAVSPS